MNVHSDLYTMKMEELNLDKTYNSMFIPFGSFQLISDRTLAREALLRFRKHMNKNGELFIPLFLPFDEFKDANKWQMLGQVQEKDGSLIILHGCSTFRYNEQRQDNWNRYEKWKDGKIVATELENMSMRWYGRYEFESLLQETGFEIVSVDGDYSDSPLSDSHSMMCFRALTSSPT